MDNFALYLLALIIPLIAQIYINVCHDKYRKIQNKKKLTGFEVARKILDSNGLKDIYVVETRGNLTDHYDPRRKTVKLSSDVFHGDSVASMAVAAHECGHAIQDKEGYLFMKIRSFIFPIVSFGTKIAYVVLFIGLIADIMDLVWAGILLVGLGLVFQLITLPVEINASKRAMVELENKICALDNDLDGTKSMLTAAALTYVAGVLSSALEILRLILIFRDRD
mgnify:FL=1